MQSEKFVLLECKQLKNFDDVFEFSEAKENAVDYIYDYVTQSVFFINTCQTDDYIISNNIIFLCKENCNLYFEYFINENVKIKIHKKSENKTCKIMLEKKCIFVSKNDELKFEITVEKSPNEQILGGITKIQCYIDKYDIVRVKLNDFLLQQKIK